MGRSCRAGTKEMNQPRKQIHQDGINALYKIELYYCLCGVYMRACVPVSLCVCVCVCVCVCIRI